MSVDSDDTDLLLLIPPDFFSVKSDSEECLRERPEKLLVSDLITQVNDLEGRICMIENQSLAMPGNLQQLRHFGSVDAINTSYKSSYNSRSLQTTPLKTQTLPSPCKSWRNFSPSKCGKRMEQNLLESYHYVNQKEKDDKILKEINEFFKHRNPSNEEEKSENEGTHLSTAVFNLNKVNDLLKQLEETQAEIEAKLKLKALNNDDDDSDEALNQPSILDKPSSVVLKSTSLMDNKSPRRFLDFNSLSPKKKSTSTAVDILTEESADSGLLKVDNMEEEPHELKLESQTQLSNLLSLCHLWGNSTSTDDVKIGDDLTILKQKYQEEKCRRQHCEELIQTLQLRLLEEQQKVAVAVKVDKEKDEAISKLSEGWNKLLSNWKELEKEKNNFSKKLQTEREKFQKEVAIACQTVKRYEAELSKALDLAHGYKEKCELTEQEKKSLAQKTSKEIESLKTELRDTREKVKKEQAQIEKLEKLAAARDEAGNQMKAKLLDFQTQVRDLKKAIKEQSNEAEILRHEKDKITEKLKDERARNLNLEQSKKTLAQTNEDLKKKEKSLKENVKSLTEEIEKTKVDLKEFYQEQVEKIVQEKLKEFQDQLTTAEKTLKKELEDRERMLSEMAVKQVQEIVDKHVQEVNLLEEKHKEELDLWKVKYLQSEEQVRELQKKTEYYSSHKTEIAQKLQTVMENQWQEALKIITASSPQHQKSPLNSGRPDPSLNRQNTFTMLSSGLGEGNLNKNGNMGPASPSDILQNEIPFYREGQLTYRENKKPDPKTSYRIDETPQKIDSESMDPLRKYIQMLLERPPGLSVDGSMDKSFDSTAFNSVTDSSTMLQWQHVLSERSSIGNSDPVSSDFMKVFIKGKENKVPWK